MGATRLSCQARIFQVYSPRQIQCRTSLMYMYRTSPDEWEWRKSLSIRTATSTDLLCVRPRVLPSDLATKRTSIIKFSLQLLSTKSTVTVLYSMECFACTRIVHGNVLVWCGLYLRKQPARRPRMNFSRAALTQHLFIGDWGERWPLARIRSTYLIPVIKGEQGKHAFTQRSGIRILPGTRWEWDSRNIPHHR